MFCAKCGTALPEGSKFCPACGTPAGNTSSASQTAFQPEAEKCTPEASEDPLVRFWNSGKAGPG